MAEEEPASGPNLLCPHRVEMPGPPACSVGRCPTRPGATRSDEDGVQTELIPLPSHIDTALRVLTCPAGTPSCGAGSDPPFARRAEATHTESAVSLSDRVSLLMPAPGLTLRHTHSHSQARTHTQNSHTRGGVHAPPGGGALWPTPLRGSPQTPGPAVRGPDVSAQRR